MILVVLVVVVVVVAVVGLIVLQTVMLGQGLVLVVLVLVVRQVSVQVEEAAGLDGLLGVNGRVEVRLEEADRPRLVLLILLLQLLVVMVVVVSVGLAVLACTSSVGREHRGARLRHLDGRRVAKVRGGASARRRSCSTTTAAGGDAAYTVPHVTAAALLVVFRTSAGAQATTRRGLRRQGWLLRGTAHWRPPVHNAVINISFLFCPLARRQRAEGSL